jgi:sulfide:quinone oxidoreductase
MMKRLLILGGGTAGTMVANKLRSRLDRQGWQITVVDANDDHLYQPGLLFVPFGIYDPHEITRPRHRYLHSGIDLVLAEVDRVEADHNRVFLVDGESLSYDYLVIASGAESRPDQTPGMLDGEWRKSVHDFYTLEGATALASKLRTWEGGRLAVQIVEMPIKCPVAPLEFSFLADWFFREHHMRDDVEITYVTPLSGAFTKPIASKMLGGMLDERSISLETDFMVESVDAERKTLVSYDEREVPFDLLVTIPLNMGAEFVTRSGLGNEVGFVPVDKHTFLSTKHDNIFALGDASDIPASKAGSVAHFAAEIFVPNFLNYIRGAPMVEAFDGHANCFVESGDGKGMLIDFNYDTEPLAGTYPVPGVGPFKLLKPTHANHWGKLAFRWIYWNVLLPGRHIPLPAHMSMVGKKTPAGV